MYISQIYVIYIVTYHVSHVRTFSGGTVRRGTVRRKKNVSFS